MYCSEARLLKPKWKSLRALVYAGVYGCSPEESNQLHKSYFMSAESGPILKSQPILYYPFSQARYPMYHCTHRSQTIGIDGLSL